MRLLIECNHVYDHPRHNSGIQRVVRNLISRLGKIKKNADAIPVILKNNKVYEVKRMLPDNDIMYILNLFHYDLIRTRELYLTYHKRIERVWPFCRSSRLRRALSLLSKIGDVLFCFSIFCVSCLCRQSEISKRIVELDVKSDDVLILLDASWHPDFLLQVEGLKSKGVAIISVIYDLIPLSHPQYCNDRLVVVFQRWFKWVCQTADGFMAISKTTQDQVQAHVRHVATETGSRHPWFDYFHLGSELDLAKNNGVIREPVKKIFQEVSPVYLMVGTIEPRKNHRYLLDAFDLLWQKGLNINLCLVGKVGWKCDAIVKCVRNHHEYHHHLFMFNDLSDTELEYCYRNSRSLVFPAYVEGFGLPLVEAMQRGLPAMASDIPVFREVGGDFIAYFDLEKPETLAALVRQYEADGKFPAVQKLADWSCLTWEDSTNQFITRIVSHVNHID